MTQPQEAAAFQKLIPPARELFDGAATVEQFVELGEGFVHEYLIKRARLQPHEHVLDVGSGNGQKARVLARHLTAGSYCGVDIVRRGVEWCQRAYVDFPNFRFVFADDLYSSHYNPDGKTPAAQYRFPFADQSFDLIFLASVFTHLMPDELENYLSEIARLLRPEGRCLATAFAMNGENMESVRAGTTAVQFPVDRGFYRLRSVTDPSSAVAYDETWLRASVRRSGLRICEMTFGRWAGEADSLHALQDAFLAVKL